MNKDKEQENHVYKIIVYGIEKCGLTPPEQEIRSRHYTLHFEPFDTHQKLNHFDGAIIFQGIFERLEKIENFEGIHTRAIIEKDELDKRNKEADLLLKKGGFICFLLKEPFYDRADNRDIINTDLTKRYLNFEGASHRNFRERVTRLSIHADEFREFLEVHGGATAHFGAVNRGYKFFPIAKARDYLVGMALHKTKYFIPTLIPNNRENEIKNYFISLANSLISLHKKLLQELPNWIQEYSFIEENPLDTELHELNSRITEINNRKNQLHSYKSILAYSGSDLVASVAKVFEEGFGIKTDPIDERREDLKLLNAESQPYCLCEIKGTNTNVKRQHINQTDTHRDESRFKENFPALLIVNTNIKNSNSLQEKDKQIENTQIKHARKNGVLILRTIDFLELLGLYLATTITIDKVNAILTTESGWLKVNREGWQVLTGDEPDEELDPAK